MRCLKCPLRSRMSLALMMLVGVTVAAGVALAGCSSGPPEPLLAGPADDGKTLTLETDQTLNVVLEGNPTTGYSWAQVPSDADILRPVGDPLYTPAPTDQPIVGSGGTFTFTYTGARAGTQKLDFVYHRSWETSVPPEKTYSLNVTVK